VVAVIIFGLGAGKIHDHGPTLPVTCPRCHNQVLYHYVSRTRWFKLYFIPVVPLSRSHLLLCPICNHGPEINREDLARVQALNAVAVGHESGTVGDEEFRRAVEAYGQGQLPELPASARPAVNAAGWAIDQPGPVAEPSARSSTPVPLEPIPVASGPPAGWYPDPTDPGATDQLRWWDGKGWSTHIKPAD
jgi:hypothetical protein